MLAPPVLNHPVAVYLTLRTPGAAATVAVLAVVLPVSPWVVLLAGNALLIALVAADVLLAPHRRRLGVRREAPEVITIGRTDRVGLMARNPTSRRLAVSLRDAAPPSLGRSPARHYGVLGPGSWGTFESTIDPSRRGVAALGPVAVRTRGPIGLAGRQGTIDLAGRIRVFPALPARREVAFRLERVRLLQAGERSSAVRGGGTEFESIREYHADDEFRRINWRATARAPRPMTNVYREQRNQQVILLLDASRTMAATIGSFSRLEYAIDAAVALAELAARLGDEAGLVAFHSRVVSVLRPAGGPSQPRRLLDALFDLQPALVAPNYREAFVASLGRNRRRSLVIMLTELADEGVMEPLFQALPVLLERHLLLVGSVLDPSLEEMARLMPGSSEEVYAKAAAGSALESRRRSAGLLRQLGVDVVDRPPGRLAGELVDRYLRVKAYGRL